MWKNWLPLIRYPFYFNVKSKPLPNLMIVYLLFLRNALMYSILTFPLRNPTTPSLLQIIKLNVVFNCYVSVQRFLGGGSGLGLILLAQKLFRNHSHFKYSIWFFFYNFAAKLIMFAIWNIYSLSSVKFSFIN